MKTQIPTSDARERKLLHSAFNQWLTVASDDDWQQLMALRAQFAPDQACSVIGLIRGCQKRQALRERLPVSLRQLLRERHWLQACDAVKALADGALPH